jgi:hypothetical protein
MDPALGTQVKERLNFEAGQAVLMLITATGKILGQGGVEGQRGTILEQNAAKVLQWLGETIWPDQTAQGGGQQQLQKLH